MAFQNKPNVAQYFLICLVFILPIFFCSNASALEKRKNIANRYINSVVWNYQGRDSQGNSANVNDISANLYRNSILDHISLYAPASGSATLINLRLNLRDDLTISRDKYFNLKIYFLVGPDLTMNTFSVPLCPRGQSSIVVDDCKITHIENESEIYKIRESLLDPSDNFQYYQVFTNMEYYYVMELTGHYEGNETTLSQLAFYNNFYNFYNSGSILDGSKLLLYFSPIEQFEYVDSAEEEVAEKELEGAQNIENQTPQNTSGGNSENQQTTNLIGVFSSFLTELQSFSATDCNLTLPFPQFIGGSQTVNICQGKDVLGNFITVVGTLLMVSFYIPLAIVLIKMIYNEIRSFTNG